jgi:hypothetical protein
MKLPPKRCPSCGEEYLHTVAICAECGVALVLASEPVLEPDLPPVSELRRVRSASLAWARGLSERLAAADIEHRIEPEDSPRGQPLCSVYVRAEDLAQAARLDAEHLRSQIPDVPEGFVPAAGDDRCPACGEAADLSAAECASCGLAFRDEE